MATDEPTPVLALPGAPAQETHWFAVDELGHVAMFRTHAVPDVAAHAWPQGSAVEVDVVPLLRDVDPELLSYEAADIFALADIPAAQRPRWLQLLGEMLDAPPRFDQSLTGVLLQLHARTGARERFAGLHLHLLPSREGGYAWGDVESPTLRELWAEGWIVRAWLGHEIEPTHMGMFAFEQEWSEVADQYQRWGEPRVPVRVHALPTALRRRLAAVRFPGVDFRERERLVASRAVAAESG